MKQHCKFCDAYLVVAGAKPIYKKGRHIGDDFYFECKRGHYWEERKIFSKYKREVK